MELRALMLAAAILDPRKWRTRLKQLGGFVAVVVWVWFRAAARAQVVRAVADAKHAQRDDAIRADNARREQARLRAMR